MWLAQARRPRRGLGHPRTHQPRFRKCCRPTPPGRRPRKMSLAQPRLPPRSPSALGSPTPPSTTRRTSCWSRTRPTVGQCAIAPTSRGRCASVGLAGCWSASRIMATAPPPCDTHATARAGIASRCASARSTWRAHRTRWAWAWPCTRADCSSDSLRRNAACAASSLDGSPSSHLIPRDQRSSKGASTSRAMRRRSRRCGTASRCGSARGRTSLRRAWRAAWQRLACGVPTATHGPPCATARVGCAAPAFWPRAGGGCAACAASSVCS